MATSRKKSDKRSYRFTMLMTEAEREMFSEVAEADRRTVADWIRVQMHAAHEKLTAAKKATKR